MELSNYLAGQRALEQNGFTSFMRHSIIVPGSKGKRAQTASYACCRRKQMQEIKQNAPLPSEFLKTYDGCPVIPVP